MKHEPGAGWRAGVARVKITPDESLWLAGWAKRTAPAQGTFSDLFATALVLEDSRGQKLVLVSADLIGIPKAMRERVIEQVKLAGVPREHFVLAASHTHCGPEIRPDKARFFHMAEPYASKIAETAERIAETIARTIDEAGAKLEPVTLWAHRSSAVFALNRRAAGGMQDHDVPVLEIRRDDGSRKAIVFGYACHNLTMPPEDGRYCSDLSGAARALLEMEFAGAVAMFVTGCAADQNPEPLGKVELVEVHGRALAAAVSESIARGGVEVKPMLSAAAEDLELAMEEISPQMVEEQLRSDEAPRRAKAQYLKERLDRGETLERSIRAPMQVVRLGDEVLMILMGGEPVAEWAVRFRQAFAGPLVWVAGYCNDLCGYLPTRRVMREGGYEGGRANLWSALPAFWTEDLEDRIEGSIRRLAERVGKAPNAQSHR